MTRAVDKLKATPELSDDIGTAIEAEPTIAWKPQEGPQSAAIRAVFVDELFYGGAAGGGKADFLPGGVMAGSVVPSFLSRAGRISTPVASDFPIDRGKVESWSVPVGLAKRFHAPLSTHGKCFRFHQVSGSLLVLDRI